MTKCQAYVPIPLPIPKTFDVVSITLNEDVFTWETQMAAGEPYAVTVDCRKGRLSTVQFGTRPLQRLHDVLMFSINIF